MHRSTVVHPMLRSPVCIACRCGMFASHLFFSLQALRFSAVARVQTLCNAAVGGRRRSGFVRGAEISAVMCKRSTALSVPCEPPSTFPVRRKFNNRERRFPKKSPQRSQIPQHTHYSTQHCDRQLSQA